MKLIIASLVIFSLVILFLFALFPSDISVSRVLQIKSPKEQLRKKITDLRTWNSWNEMLMSPPSKEITNNQADRIDSNFLQIGGLSISLIKTSQDTVITRWQQSGKSFTGKYILAGTEGQVILEWTLYFHIKWYPWDKLASMFYEKKLGPMMEQSLLNLQKELEAPGIHPR